MADHNGKFVAYYRVSTARQGESGLGLDAQRKAVVEYLNGGKWVLSGEFVEVESGKKNDRPQLAAALEMCRKQKATLVVAKLDRLARNLHFISALIEAKVDFIACDFPQANKLTIQILAAVAEHERDMIAKRTKDALAALKDRGVKLGSPTPEIGSEAGNAVIMANADDYASRVQPIIADIMKSGLTSLREIAEALEMRGVKTPRGNTHWYASQVRNVMNRKAG
jgi:DNA invertase Pin-like site-specific DNA recombinase